MTFNVDGISLLEKGETPDEALAKELGKRHEAGFPSPSLGFFTFDRLVAAMAEALPSAADKVGVRNTRYESSFFPV